MIAFGLCNIGYVGEIEGVLDPVSINSSLECYHSVISCFRKCNFLSQKYETFQLGFQSNIQSITSSQQFITGNEYKESIGAHLFRIAFRQRHSIHPSTTTTNTMNRICSAPDFEHIFRLNYLL